MVQTRFIEDLEVTSFSLGSNFDALRMQLAQNWLEEEENKRRLSEFTGFDKMQPSLREPGMSSGGLGGNDFDFSKIGFDVPKSDQELVARAWASEGFFNQIPQADARDLLSELRYGAMRDSLKPLNNHHINNSFFVNRSSMPAHKAAALEQRYRLEAQRNGLSVNDFQVVAEDYKPGDPFGITRSGHRSDGLPEITHKVIDENNKPSGSGNAEENTTDTAVHETKHVKQIVDEQRDPSKYLTTEEKEREAYAYEDIVGMQEGRKSGFISKDYQMIFNKALNENLGNLSLVETSAAGLAGLLGSEMLHSVEYPTDLAGSIGGLNVDSLNFASPQLFEAQNTLFDASAQLVEGQSRLLESMIASASQLVAPILPPVSEALIAPMQVPEMMFKV